MKYNSRETDLPKITKLVTESLFISSVSILILLLLLSCRTCIQTVALAEPITSIRRSMWGAGKWSQGSFKDG